MVDFLMSVFYLITLCGSLFIYLFGWIFLALSLEQISVITLFFLPTGLREKSWLGRIIMSVLFLLISAILFVVSFFYQTLVIHSIVAHYYGFGI